MSDINSRSEEGSTQGAADRALQSRRAVVRRAALIGLPVVLATIPSRTVWARPKKPMGTPTVNGPALTACGSACPSTTASQSLIYPPLT